jgi:hypothetical protein
MMINPFNLAMLSSTRLERGRHQTGMLEANPPRRRQWWKISLAVLIMCPANMFFDHRFFMSSSHRILLGFEIDVLWLLSFSLALACRLWPSLEPGFRPVSRSMSFSPCRM